jgi:AraC-like DNA-binding protein
VYQLNRPAGGLAAYVEHYWFVSTRPGETLDLTVDVYVDARADLVFNFGVPYTRTVIGARPRLQEDANLDAQRIHPIRIAQKGAVVLTGVRFHTAGLSPFVSTPVHRWNNLVVPIAEVFGPDVLLVEGALRSAAAADDIQAQSRILDGFFVGRLRLTEPMRAFLSLKSSIEAAGGLIRMDALCDAGAISIRHLDRLFRSYLGFSPKTFARIVRFQRALTLLKGDPGCTLAEVAASCGYYDQPHFVREFKAFTGVVPRAQVGYFPADAPSDFSPNLVQFIQDPRGK